MPTRYFFQLFGLLLDDKYIFSSVFVLKRFIRKEEIGINFLLPCIHQLRASVLVRFLIYCIVTLQW